MIYVMLPPAWMRDENPDVRPIQKECTFEEALALNEQGYNTYYYPNYPSVVHPGFVKAEDVDTFEWVFVDMDLKAGDYTKDDFISLVLSNEALNPSSVVDSGNGIHVYWRVSDLDAMSFLKLSRRLMRHFKTDDAVQQLKQLMRVPGTLNTKDPENLRPCEEIYSSDSVYTCEQLDKLLPPIQKEDLEYCKNHYDRAHNLQEQKKVDEKLPVKFGQLLQKSEEVRDIWTGEVDDRSKADYRLGHILYGAGFTKAEALSVLVNSAKALSRAPTHRIAYAEGIVEKIFTFEETKDPSMLSSSVRDILNKAGANLKGTRFPCWKWFDDTHHGFRLGQVLGLVGGVGIGKTAISLDLFMGWVQLNPDYIHFFVSLEQPASEIAERWKDRCGENTQLYDKVQILSNYNDDGSYRNLSLDEIADYIMKFKEVNKVEVGCVVVDHIGVLKKKGRKGENQDLMDICHNMKAFAIRTNTYLVMQSQAPRQKAGIGDLELDKDASYGTVFFEAYCDYLVTLWQPLKRCYDNPDCPTVTAFKFCKIRHKKRGNDTIIEDVRYVRRFDPTTGTLSDMTQSDDKAFQFFNNQATNRRQKDKKTDVLDYVSAREHTENEKQAV